MTQDKWNEIQDRVDEQFGIINQGEEELPEPPGAYREFIEFESPMGLVRLEYTVKPKVEGTQTIGGSKYGAASNVEKIYSQDEVVRTFSALREVDGEWIPVEAEGFM